MSMRQHRVDQPRNHNPLANLRTKETEILGNVPTKSVASRQVAALAATKLSEAKTNQKKNDESCGLMFVDESGKGIKQGFSLR